MNPRHAVALALVGWYLMIPPLPQDSSLLADPTPPLSVWYLEQSFDTAKECESARKTEIHEAELQMHALAHAHAIEANMGHAQFYLQHTFSQCIATDDPRLNEE
jgi:hypothetical protein